MFLLRSWVLHGGTAEACAAFPGKTEIAMVDMFTKLLGNPHAGIWPDASLLYQQILLCKLPLRSAWMTDRS